MKTITFCRIEIFIAMLTVMYFPSIATASEDVSLENRGVDDVVDAFDYLTDRGEWLGFYMGPAPETIPSYPFPPESAEHFQGIARSPRVGTPPILYATRSGNIENSDYYGSLVVVELSCSNTDGERLGSNRLVKDHETWDTPPPCAGDKVIKNIPFEDYEHPGGIQMVGDILAVPLEKPKEGQGLPEGKVVFFDCSDPKNPQRLPYELDFNHAVGVLGITRLPEEPQICSDPDGCFFMVVSWGDGETLEFYKSNGLDSWSLHGPPLSKETLEELAENGYWRFGHTTPQTLNFVNGKDGTLYLIGSSNDYELSPFPAGDDHMFLWRVEGWKTPGYPLNPQPKLVGLRGEVHKYLRSEGCLDIIGWVDVRQEANFNAGGGAYVSPTGELLYYGISHYNVGPEDTVKMAELRHKWVSRTGTCGPQFQPNHLGGPYNINELDSLTLDGTVYFIEPWVLMFEHSNYEGISVMVDWRTRDNDDYDDFRKLDGCLIPLPDGFNDQMSSYIWCAPKGSSLKLYKDDHYGNQYSETNGENKVFEVGYVGDDFNDEATSMAFYWDRPDNPFSWDLDGDGVFEDEVGPKATFYAACGSSTNKVSMKYTYKTDGTVYDIEEAEINVHNVAPAVTAIAGTVDENGTATVSGTITDPCTQTTFKVEIDWGEGTPETYMYPAGTTSYSETHQYLDDNPTGTSSDVYEISVTVTDDDGGEGTAATTITVNNVAPAVTAIGDIVDENGTATVSGTITDAGTQDTFSVEIDWGEGTPETYMYSAGTTSYSETHQYLDDNPTGTSSDVYEISVTVTDDDGGEGTAATTVTVNNVAPVTNIDSITDENGAEIGIEVPVTLIGLIVNVAGSFTDVGMLDTHTASMYWVEGISDDLGVVSGTTEAIHIYTNPGDYTMTLAVTDDDTGVGTATALITVVDDEGATATAIQELIPLTDDPNIAAALNKLNGALEKLEESKLEEDKLIAGLGMIKQAIEYIEAAEAANPGLDLIDIKGLLALTAKSVTVGAIEQAETLTTKPNELQKIEQAKMLVAEGDALRTATDYAGAVEKYQQAIQELPNIKLAE